MAIPQPQTDLPRDGIQRMVSGGSDFWDEGAAGEIVTDEYFQPNAFWIKVGGVWRKARLWVKVSGVWKRATPRVKVGGVWR